MPTRDAVAIEAQGTLGGAAAGKPRSLTPSRPAIGLPAPIPTTRAPVLLWLVIAAAATVIGSSILIRSHYQVRPVTEEIAKAVSAGEALLEQDDEASLGRAEASFATAESLEPLNADHHAERAFAMLLKGASLRAESDDLLSELGRSTPAPEVLAAMPEAERIRLQQHANTIRQQLPVLTSRSDELIRKGLWLARSAERQGESPSLKVRRTTWLANAYDRRIDRLTKPPYDAGTSGSGRAWLGWWHLARGIARELSDAAAPTIGTAESELKEAVRESPANLRAKWELARLYLARTPPDPQASPLLEQILSANPQHEGALRGAAMLKSQPRPELDPN
jgi:hypothetical protein